MTKTIKHTPAPWWASESLDIGTEPTMAIKIVNRVSGANYKEAEANAQLIAAAPELLDALKELFDLHEPNGRLQPSYYKPILKKCALAIRKATGEYKREIEMFQ